MPKIIHVYNENCVLAGRPVRSSVLSEYDDLNDFADCHPEEVTEDNLEWHIEKGGAYHRQIANSIRNAME